MRFFFRIHGFRLLLIAVILIILFLLPNNEARYLKHDLLSLKRISDYVLMVLISLLVLITISVSFKKPIKLKDRFQYLVGYTVCGLALFFIMRNFFLPLMMLVNQSITNERESLGYKLVNKGSNYDLLLDLAKNRTFLVEDEQRPSTTQELHTGDTITAKFKKGLLGVNFDPEFSKKWL